MNNEIRLVFGRYVIALPVNEFLFTGMWPQVYDEHKLTRVIIPVALYGNDNFFQQVRGMLLEDSVRIEWDDNELAETTIPVDVVKETLPDHIPERPIGMSKKEYHDIIHHERFSELRRNGKDVSEAFLRTQDTMDVEKIAEQCLTGESPRAGTMSTNVGKSDYAQHAIQPWDVWDAYNLNPYDCDIVKRILRDKSEEDTLLDYRKIQHICQKRIDDIESGNDPWGKK